MPRALIDRLRMRPNSIREFAAASLERMADGRILAAAGRRTGAIYVWGYAAEMALKASYFEVILYAPAQPIGPADLRSAQSRATVLGFSWPVPRNFHNLSAWAELVTRERVARGRALRPTRATALIRAGHRLSRLWQETLRYHSNRAYSYEVDQVERLVGQIMNLCEVA
jgi:hypothetical protein